VKSTVETLSPTRVRLAIEVPFEELKPSLDAAYKKIGAQVKVPGFRPGKVPPRVIDQRVGRGAVLEEAINAVLPQVYGEAARDAAIQPLGQPDIDVTNLEDGQTLSFTAEVDVRPDITLPELSGLAVTVDVVAVSDADLEEQLDGLRDRFGTLKGVERPVQTGDYVSLDLVAIADGAEVEGGSAKGLSYEVGSGDLISGLDDAIIGKAVGESAIFTSTLQQGDSSGSEAEITATVNSVKEKELPPVDDDFAQLASEFDTVDQLKDDLRNRLSMAKAFEQGAQARDRVLDMLLESVEFELPESLVRAEVDYREHEIVHSLGHDDGLVDRYLSTQGKTREEFDAELREGAEKSVRGQLLLDAIADQTKVQIGDSELTEYLVREAVRYEMAPQEFANKIVQAGNLPDVIAGVRRSKALAGVLETAVITDESGNPVDLAALTEATRDNPASTGDRDEQQAEIDDDVEQSADIESDDAEQPIKP